MSELTERFKADREALGWSQADMGDFLGVSRQVICKFEKGRMPMPSRWLERLPDYYADLWVEDARDRAAGKVSILRRAA